MQFNKLYPFKHAASGQVILNQNDIHMMPAVALTGEYSPEEVEVFQAILRPDSVVLEVGGCFGLHTLPLAEICSAGSVLVLEPQIYNYQVLVGNLALNSIRNVAAKQAGAVAKAGTLQIPQFDPERENNFGHMQATGHDEGLPVEGLVIDSLGFKRLDLIKLDCEGDELQALQGARATIQKFRPWLYLEFTDNRAEILEFLREIGYLSRRHMPTHIATPNYLNANITSELIFGSDMILCWHESWPEPRLRSHWRETTTDDILQPNTDNRDASRSDTDSGS